MFRWLIGPRFAQEIELDRPASGWPERIFHFCVYYFLFAGLAAVILELFLPEKTVEAKLGTLGLVLGIIFGLCFLYLLNYLAYRFVRNRFIRWAWFSLEAFLALMLAWGFLIRR